LYKVVIIDEMTSEEVTHSIHEREALAVSAADALFPLMDVMQACEIVHSEGKRIE
jgi:hypothetical protein